MRAWDRETELECEGLGQGDVALSFKVTVGSPCAGMDNAGGRRRFGIRNEAHLFCSAHLIITHVFLLPSAGRDILIGSGLHRIANCCVGLNSSRQLYFLSCLPVIWY